MWYTDVILLVLKISQGDHKFVRVIRTASVIKNRHRVVNWRILRGSIWSGIASDKIHSIANAIDVNFIMNG